MRTRTTWREKLERVQDARIEPVPPLMQKRLGGGTLLIPKPLDVDATIRRVPKGKLTTVGRIRRALAQDAGADVACPLTTGIFLRIAAETAEEDRARGVKRVAPYWRVVRDDGALMEKFPGGPRAQADLLRQEGHEILPGKVGRVRLEPRLLAEL